MTFYGLFVNILRTYAETRAIGLCPIRPGGMAMQAYAMPIFYKERGMMQIYSLEPFAQNNDMPCRDIKSKITAKIMTIKKWKTKNLLK